MHRGDTNPVFTRSRFVMLFFRKCWETKQIASSVGSRAGFMPSSVSMSVFFFPCPIRLALRVSLPSHWLFKPRPIFDYLKKRSGGARGGRNFILDSIIRGDFIYEPGWPSSCVTYIHTKNWWLMNTFHLIQVHVRSIPPAFRNSPTAFT